MAAGNAPYHAHIYYSDEERPAAETLHDEFQQRIEMGDLSGQSQGDTHMPSAEGAMFPEATT